MQRVTLSPDDALAQAFGARVRDRGPRRIERSRRNEPAPLPRRGSPCSAIWSMIVVRQMAGQADDAIESKGR